jgi:hypothetical protein
MKTVIWLIGALFMTACSQKDNTIDPEKTNIEQGSYQLYFTAKQNYVWGINQEFGLPKKENVFEFNSFVIIYEDPLRRGVYDWHLLVLGRQFAKPDSLNLNLAPLNNYNEHGTLVRIFTSKIPNDSTVNATYFYKTPNGNYGRLKGKASHSFFRFNGDSLGVNVDVMFTYEVLTDGSRTFPK